MGNIFALDVNKLNYVFSKKDQTKLKMFPVRLADSLSLSLNIYIPSFKKKKEKKKRAIAWGKWSSECYSVLWALMASVNDMGCSVVCVLLSHPWCNDPSTLMPPQGTMSTSIPHLHLYNYPPPTVCRSGSHRLYRWMISLWATLKFSAECFSINSNYPHWNYLGKVTLLNANIPCYVLLVLR